MASRTAAGDSAEEILAKLVASTKTSFGLIRRQQPQVRLCRAGQSVVRRVSGRSDEWGSGRALPKICSVFACPVGERQLFSADNLFHRGQYLRTLSATNERCERQHRVDQEDWQTCLLHSLARNIIRDRNVL